jgi:hypothetical protein
MSTDYSFGNYYPVGDGLTLLQVNPDLAADLNADRKTYGWLYTRHADGHWVTMRKLSADEIEMAHDQAADGAVLQGTKVSDRIMAHPHKDLIIALLDDPTLEVEEYNGALEKWFAFETKTQSRVLPYIINNPERLIRLREKPKPDVVVTYPVHMKGHCVKFYPTADMTHDNLRLTFTADGTLKNAEVI